MNDIVIQKKGSNTDNGGSIIGKWKADEQYGIQIVAPADFLKHLKYYYSVFKATDAKMSATARAECFEAMEDRLNSVMIDFSTMNDDRAGFCTAGLVLGHVCILQINQRHMTWDENSGAWHNTRGIWRRIDTL